MEQLHATLADKMTTILNSGEVVKIGEEVVRITPTAATMSCVRQFLKDNNIEAAVGRLEKAANAAAGLPFPAVACDDSGDDRPDHQVKH
jgi:hypothetical protein